MQIASVLAVALFLLALQSARGLICKTNLPLQELELKVPGVCLGGRHN